MSQRACLNACLSSAAALILMTGVAQSVRAQDSVPAATPMDQAPKERAPVNPAPERVRMDEGGGVDLRPKFVKGQTLKYQMEVNSKSKVTPPGGKKEDAADSSMLQAIGLTMQVVEVKEGVATVKLVYDSFKVKVKTKDAELEYDSQIKPDPRKKRDGLDDQDLFGPIFQQMVGTTMMLTVDRDGKITSVTGGENLNLLGGIPGAGGVDPKALGALFGPINTAGTAGGRRNVGDKWTSTDSMSVGPLGQFTMVTTNHLVNARAGMAEVQVVGAASANSQGEVDLAGSTVKLRNATYKGKYTWDTERGRLVGMEMEQSTQIGGQVEATSSSTMKVTTRK
ncbi:hypothetical protein BH11PLA1_BH11PLA1_14790 [soil metagenome]